MLIDLPTTEDTVDYDRIASVAHEANRAYCRTLDDFSQQPWEGAPDWQQKSAENGVEAIANGHVTRPEESHENWFAEKKADGWGYDVVKDPENKLHPCMVPFDELPPEQQAKDRLFFAIVKALLDLP